MFVVWITLVVQLPRESEGTKIEWVSQIRGEGAHQLENCDLHHTLVEVCWFIFYHLHSNDFVRLHILTFHDLPKRSLTEDVQDQIPCGEFSQRRTEWGRIGNTHL